MSQYTQLPLFNQAHLKRCNVCQRELPATSEFWHVRKASADGMAYTCKDCVINRTHKWYDADPDRARQAKREYHSTHKAEVRAYRSKRADHYRELKQTPEYKAKEATRRKRKSAELLEYNRKYRAAHPELYSKATVEYRKRNPEKVRASVQRRLAHRKNVPGNFTDTDLREMYADQSGHCGYCGIGLCGDYWIEHMQPITRGGTSHPDNILLTCKPCNLSKGNKTVDEWVSIRGW